MKISIPRTVIVFVILLFLSVSKFCGSFLVQAEEVQRIAAIVNDQIISSRDLNDRIHLVITLSKLPNTLQTQNRLKSQILKQLIDEKLEVQEAKRLRISVSDADMSNAREIMEKRIRIPMGTFENFLKTNGINKLSAIGQIYASLAWTKLVQRQFSSISEISEEEVDEIIERFNKNLGKKQYFLSEILLNVDDPATEKEISKFAERLHGEIISGANFSAVAQEFSNAVSAKQGGRIGWIFSGQLADELDTSIQQLNPGEISKPIRTLFGYHIIKLEETRVLKPIDTLKTRVRLNQVVLPIPNSATQKEIAKVREVATEVSTQAKNCGQMKQLAKKWKSPARAELGNFLVKELSPHLREIALKLELNTPSKPLQLASGFVVIMVCERANGPSNIPSRTFIKQRLQGQRLENFARRYIQDLRSSAFIEIRI